MAAKGESRGRIEWKNGRGLKGTGAENGRTGGVQPQENGALVPVRATISSVVAVLKEEEREKELMKWTKGVHKL